MKIFHSFETKKIIYPTIYGFWAELDSGKGTRTGIITTTDDPDYLTLIYDHHFLVNGYLTKEDEDEIRTLVYRAETTEGYYIGRILNLENRSVKCFHPWCSFDFTTERFLCFECKTDLGDLCKLKNMKRKVKHGKLWTNEWRVGEFFS